MAPEHTERLRAIKTFPQLVAYLRDELDWNIESDNFEDLTFDYEPEELGLDPKSAAKVKQIKQLRPLVSNQPWGIFFISFEPKQLPVVALRRILRALVLKKRASANKADLAKWASGDLLFISSYGEADHRDVSFAHFVESDQKGDLPTLKVLAWDDEDTGLRLRDVHTRLREHLTWPSDPKDTKAWRDRWANAFVLEHREVIRTSKELAVAMAHLAQRIRKRALRVLEVESKNGPLRKMMEAFKEALIHDLDDDGFADMYAQTITYGLLTARLSRPAGLVADNVVDMVPVTNPFLRDLLQMFLSVGGRKAKIDFDELGVNDVVHALRQANMEQVVKDFGDKNPQEDPVIHFYELFLKEYDAKKRMQRGVFYTPRPVVSYIVRSVHELLQTEFGLEDGLADTTTWGEMAKRHKGLTIPEGVDPKSPFVNILDPATGTATFLVEVIDLIHKTMKAKWLKQGHMQMELKHQWNKYVPLHLLPRIHGYELMMAPYAVAHMKLDLKLQETGFDAWSNLARAGCRGQVYLTNALEPPTTPTEQKRIEQWAPALAHEAEAVNAIKRTQRFSVVLGNPPYAAISANMSANARALIETYKTLHGKPIVEKGALQFEKNVNDDYVKFIRLAQTLCHATQGVAAYISNNTYLDSITLRGMRASLLKTFPMMHFTDLHGDVDKRETADDGSKDENVFDIKHGVAIVCAVAHSPDKLQPGVFRVDLKGSQRSKFGWLQQHTYSTAEAANCNPAADEYFFRAESAALRTEYRTGTSLNDLCAVSSSGFESGRDEVLTGFTPDELRATLEHFCTAPEAEVREAYSVQEAWGAKLLAERRSIITDPDFDRRIVPFMFAPFDQRWCYFNRRLLKTNSFSAGRHLRYGENFALVCMRQVSVEGPFSHAFVSRLIVNNRAFYSTKGKAQYFPMLAFRGTEDVVVRPGTLEGTNLDLAILPRTFTDLVVRSVASSHETDIALGVLHYSYAQLFSPTYRVRYKEFLQSDFPRIQLGIGQELVNRLVRCGRELVALHLLQSPNLDKHRSEFVGKRVTEIEKVSYADQTVWIDKKQTTGFKGVPEDVWNFHIGGYQVCHKWLKDRKGRTLSQDDITHYHKIVVALSETIRLMAEIDKVINQHGGWPAAFQRKESAK